MDFLAESMWARGDQENLSIWGYKEIKANKEFKGVKGTKQCKGIWQSRGVKDSKEVKGVKGVKEEVIIKGKWGVKGIQGKFMEKGDWEIERGRKINGVMGVKWVMIKKEGRGENNIYKGLPRKMKGGKIRNFVKVLLWMLNVQNDFHFL